MASEQPAESEVEVVGRRYWLDAFSQFQEMFGENWYNEEHVEGFVWKAEQDKVRSGDEAEKKVTDMFKGLAESLEESVFLLSGRQYCFKRKQNEYQVNPDIVMWWFGEHDLIFFTRTHGFVLVEVKAVSTNNEEYLKQVIEKANKQLLKGKTDLRVQIDNLIKIFPDLLKLSREMKKVKSEIEGQLSRPGFLAVPNLSRDNVPQGVLPSNSIFKEDLSTPEALWRWFKSNVGVTRSRHSSGNSGTSRSRHSSGNSGAARSRHSSGNSGAAKSRHSSGNLPPIDQMSLDDTSRREIFNHILVGLFTATESMMWPKYSNGTLHNCIVMKTIEQCKKWCEMNQEKRIIIGQAGTGKTTLLIVSLIEDFLKNEKSKNPYYFNGLFLCFNRALKDSIETILREKGIRTVRACTIAGLKSYMRGKMDIGEHSDFIPSAQEFAYRYYDYFVENFCYTHIYVDEGQDIEEDEINLIELIHYKEGRHKKLLIVGDPWQDIHYWKKGRRKSLLSLDRQFQQSLTTVVRTTKNIYQEYKGHMPRIETPYVVVPPSFDGDHVELYMYDGLWSSGVNEVLRRFGLRKLEDVAVLTMFDLYEKEWGPNGERYYTEDAEFVVNHLTNELNDEDSIRLGRAVSVGTVENLSKGTCGQLPEELEELVQMFHAHTMEYHTLDLAEAKLVKGLEKPIIVLVVDNTFYPTYYNRLMLYVAKSRAICKLVILMPTDFEYAEILTKTTTIKEIY